MVFTVREIFNVYRNVLASFITVATINGTRITIIAGNLDV
jgi:hypothetical protein